MTRASVWIAVLCLGCSQSGVREDLVWEGDLFDRWEHGKCLCDFEESIVPGTEPYVYLDCTADVASDTPGQASLFLPFGSPEIALAGFADITVDVTGTQGNALNIGTAESIVEYGFPQTEVERRFPTRAYAPVWIDHFFMPAQGFCLPGSDTCMQFGDATLSGELWCRDARFDSDVAQ